MLDQGRIRDIGGGILRRRRISKSQLFHKIFTERRRPRESLLQAALEKISDQDSAFYLNRAAPVAIDLGRGFIECDRFGSILEGLMSYRPRDRHPDCTALIGSISLEHIKNIKVIY
jgi:hypothetical protein